MIRRPSSVVTWLCLITLGLISVNSSVADDAATGKVRFYIGTYNSKASEGIYRSELDLATGKVSEPVLAAPAKNASFLAIHPNKRFLYAVSEEGAGGVAAYAVNQETGNLTLLNQQSSGGAGPCHLVVDKPGTHVLVANYSGGNAAVLPISADGKLEPRSSLVQHEPVVGKNDRKKAPLAHSINLDAAGQFAFVCDAGVDKVFIYRYDAMKGTLTPNTPPAGLVAPDAAPRHFAWRPDGRQAYAINESELSVTVFDYDAKTGALTAVQTISTVPEGVDRKGFSTAEVVVHPSGKFVYGSNRGHDTIAGFKVDASKGRLTAIGQFAQGTMKTPRNFNIDPTGTFALVEGQDSDNIVSFRIDPESGEFRPTSYSIKVGKPVCIKFVRDEKANPVGTWQCEYKIGEQKRTSTLTVKMEGDKFDGTMSWADQKDEKIKDAKFKDGKLTFSAVRKFMGNTIPIDYTLTIDGDKFKGKGASEFGGQKQEFDIEGKRETKDK